MRPDGIRAKGAPMIHPRRLAAVDVVYLGPRLTVVEFACGVIGPAAIGILTLHRWPSASGTLVGVYMLSMALNYVPMLWHAVDLVRHRSAKAAIADESGNLQVLFSRYRRQSLWLLVPLAAPIAAYVQRSRRR
jgi:hypothetical protein